MLIYTLVFHQVLCAEVLTKSNVEGRSCSTLGKKRNIWKRKRTHICFLNERNYSSFHRWGVSTETSELQPRTDQGQAPGRSVSWKTNKPQHSQVRQNSGKAEVHAPQGTSSGMFTGLLVKIITAIRNLHCQLWKRGKAELPVAAWCRREGGTCLHISVSELEGYASGDSKAEKYMWNCALPGSIRYTQREGNLKLAEGDTTSV